MGYPQLKTYTKEITRDKFKYIADKNKRNASKELELLVEKHIENYEKENGEIVLQNTPPRISKGD